jgi:hypothetical protein
MVPTNRAIQAKQKDLSLVDGVVDCGHTEHAPAQIYRASQFRNAGAICSPDIDQNRHRSTKEREFGAGVGSETDVCCSHPCWVNSSIG